MTNELHQVESRIESVQKQLALLKELLAHLEGKRDTLIAEAADNAGCHDQRFAVR